MDNRDKAFILIVIIVIGLLIYTHSLVAQVNYAELRIHSLEVKNNYLTENNLRLSERATELAENYSSLSNYFNTELKNRIESYKMLTNDSLIKNSDIQYGIDGMWYKEGYYCIRYNATNETDATIHEKCHAHIQENYSHFCKDYFSCEG